MRREPVGRRPTGIEGPAGGHVHRLGPEGPGAVTRLWRWVRLHPIVLFVVFFSALAFLGFRDTREQNDKLKEVVADLEAERVARQVESCEGALATRVEQEAMWTRILTNAGVDEQSLTILHDGYDNLPSPASC